MIYKYRDYQLAAIKNTLYFLSTSQRKNGLVVMPTGSGKSLVIAGTILEVLKKYKIKILILSHVKEILIQDYDKLVSLLPEKKIGIYSASLKQKEVEDITLGSVQSIANAIELFQSHKLILVDEAHTISEDGEGAYNKIIQGIANSVVIGYTATPYRYNSSLTDANHIFSKVFYNVKISTLVKKGYLCKVFSKNTKTKIDVSKLKVIAGDYSKKSMSEEIDRLGITKAICDNLAFFKEERKHWLLFCVSIEHALNVAKYLTSIGVTAMAVHSKMETWERDLVIRLHKEGKLQCIAQVNILSVGYDFPEIDLIGLLRPTRSQVFHRQAIGRGFRIADGKKDCVVLDYAGNCRRLGPVDIEPEFLTKTKGKGNGAAITKACPICDEILPIAVKVCSDCGYEFPEAPKLTVYAKDAPILAEQKSQIKPAKYTVTGVFYAKIQKPGKPATLKVTYKVPGLKRFSEWIAIESPFPNLRAKASSWWLERAGEMKPKTVDEALLVTSSLKVPSYIEVDESSKYPEINKYYFKGAKNEHTN